MLARRDAEEPRCWPCTRGLLGAGGRLLVSVDRPPGALQCHFADLGSRLRGAAAYQVRSLDDAGRAACSSAGDAPARARARVPPVLDFWLSRSIARPARLLDQLDRLDTAAMAAQRRVTVPLVKQVLGL
jgi:DnaA-homolog protein